MDKRDAVVEAAREYVESHLKRYEYRSDEASVLVAALDALDALPASGPKWNCRVVPTGHGFDVRSADDSAFLGRFSGVWHEYAHATDVRRGVPSFDSESAALAALEACKTPPPGWVDTTATVCECGYMVGTGWPCCTKCGKPTPKASVQSAPEIERETPDAINPAPSDLIAGAVVLPEQLNTSDGSAPPIEQVGAKACNPTRTITDAKEIVATLNALPVGARVKAAAFHAYNQTHDEQPGSVCEWGGPYGGHAFMPGDTRTLVCGNQPWRGLITSLTFDPRDLPAAATPAPTVEPALVAFGHVDVTARTEIATVRDALISLVARVGEIEKDGAERDDEHAALRRDVDGLKAKVDTGDDSRTARKVTDLERTTAETRRDLYAHGQRLSVVEANMNAAMGEGRESTPPPPATGAYEVEECPHNPRTKSRVVRYDGLFMLIENGYIRWISDAWTPLPDNHALAVAAALNGGT